MRKKLLIFLLFCAFNTKAQNLILNGSFEDHDITICYEQMPSSDFNTKVSFITSFGSDIQLTRDSCERCNPPTFWGGGAQDGNWMAFLRSKPVTLPQGVIWAQSKFSFDLDHPLSSEKNYKLSFYIKKPPFFPPNTTGCVDDPYTNSIKVGISNSPTSFETHLYKSPVGDSIWTQYSVVFNSQNAEEYVTVEINIEDSTLDKTLLLVDNFVLVETEEPVSVQEQYNKKQLLRIIDVLGRETPYKKNTPLFYLYNDGTVEKKIFVE